MSTFCPRQAVTHRVEAKPRHRVFYKVRDRYWIESASPNSVWSPNSGKWLLFITVGRIDSAWKLIEVETRSERLGISAKVATAKPNSLAANSGLRLVCVYTYECTNIEDSRPQFRGNAAFFLAHIKNG